MTSFTRMFPEGCTRQMALLLVCLTLVLDLLSPLTEACMCGMTHPQNSFCDADFVVKAKVKHMKSIFRKRLTDDEEVTVREPFENRYSIRVKNIYKGKEALKDIDQMHVFTSAHDSMCGVSLNIGHTYVMTGSIRNNKMNINICNFVKKWDNLPRWQRRGMVDRYAQNCDCQPKVCYNDNCYHKNRVEGREDICILDLHRDRLMCHINHSFCKRVNSECTWSHTSQWRDCRKKTRGFLDP